MSFFGPPPDVPEMPGPPKWGPPLWDRAAEDTLGISVGMSELLAVTDEHAVVFEDVHAYPNGFTFDLVIMSNPNIPIDHTDMAMRHRSMFRSGPRLGLEFADGSVASTEQPGMPVIPGGGSWSTMSLTAEAPGASRPGFDADGVPLGHVLRMQGGGGGQHRQDNRFWCYGLPPAGDMTIHADWPEHFDEVAIVVDATPILEAAGRSRILWERPEP